MTDRHEIQRRKMVERQIAARGIQDERVLAAMGRVPREAFVPADLQEFAYDDNPLPIAEGQTISQPYIVALMAEAARIGPEARVLEVGTGSGYAAAVYAELAGHVVTVERHASLAEGGQAALARAGYTNVEVLEGDGSTGVGESAPYDAILVAAGAPAPPDSLKRQLADGGRLVIPVAVDAHQELRVITRRGEAYDEVDLGAVRFVPLLGEEGWLENESGTHAAPTRREKRDAPAPRLIPADALPRAIANAARALDSVSGEAVASLLDDVGDASVVLLGEASHGTSEFYQARAAITRRLVERHGFNIVAVEADWPDAARIDRYVRHREPASAVEPVFSRFPTWMWRNEEVLAFVEWMRGWNLDRPRDKRASFHGLDLYGLSSSMVAVIDYLQDVDPEAARVARERYGCLTPWQKDPAAYGRVALMEGNRRCEKQVVSILRDLLARRMDYLAEDREAYLEAEGNARLVTAAETYYRTMYYGYAESWNQRDRHMFATLERVMEAAGRQAAPWCGRTIRTWAMRRRPRWAGCATRSTLASWRASASVRPQFWWGSEPTAARSPPRRTGTGRWRSRRSGPLMGTAMRRCASGAASRVFR
jgi:protein-L-isoaspartate(D-aspartate) O-methyltransferase